MNLLRRLKDCFDDGMRETAISHNINAVLWDIYFFTGSETILEKIERGYQELDKIPRPSGLLERAYYEAGKMIRAYYL
tara:strand:+ start:1383 stop:1616 length:234 start_codon:yes stop_codon:yes gene_type:complete